MTGDHSTDLVPVAPSTTGPTLQDLAIVADTLTARSAFSDYQARRAGNTLRRQRDDLALFSVFIAQAGLHVGDLYRDPAAWSGVSYGLVESFVRWQLQAGYAVGSINVRLSTVKVYCKLAVKAGVLTSAAYAMIALVSGFQHKEQANIDEARPTSRVGRKKAEAVVISRDQAERLKEQPDTPQGTRDALLVCLLLDHGLRCGEVAALQLAALNLDEGTLKFYRQKVAIVQTHELTRDTLLAARRYLEVCRPGPGAPLLLGSRKGGTMGGRMSERAITDRMRVLCARIGIVGASAHDGRHAWATFAIKGGTDIKSLQDAGGWASPAMPLRYAASGKIANAGVKLG